MYRQEEIEYTNRMYRKEEFIYALPIVVREYIVWLHISSVSIECSTCFFFALSVNFQYLRSLHKMNTKRYSFCTVCSLHYYTISTSLVLCTAYCTLHCILVPIHHCTLYCIFCSNWYTVLHFSCVV